MGVNLSPFGVSSTDEDAYVITGGGFQGKPEPYQEKIDQLAAELREGTSPDGTL